MRPNNREKILETARGLFLKHGYNGISIRTIAARAKLTTGAIYFHFRDKRDIYRTICLESIGILLSRLRDGIDGAPTPPRKLISTFDSYMKFFHENRDHYNLLMELKGAYGDGDGDGREIAEGMKEIITLMSRTAELGIEAGRFREIDPAMLSLFLAAIGEGMLQYRKMGLLDSMKVSEEDFRSFMADMIGRGLERRS